MPVSPCGDKISSCLLWRQDLHRVEGKCKLENLHPHGKTCTRGLKTCIHKSLETQFFSNSFMPGDSSTSDGAQALPKGSINILCHASRNLEAWERAQFA